MSANLLVEIGMEELPPKALTSLVAAFESGVADGLREARLEFANIHAYGSPRRLALVVESLGDRQPDREVEQKGPPVRIAFNDAGEPQPPALAFAKKCGVEVDQLQRTETDKGEWLTFVAKESGQPMTALIHAIVEKSLLAMPIPRRMRWSDSDIEFVRPVHWVVMLHGDEVVPGEILGVESGRATHGHRFHSSGEIELTSADGYVETLRTKGHVLVDMDERRARVVDGVIAKASELGGEVREGESLYDEVNALVEWPVPVVGSFEEQYLDLPPEVVVSTLTGHQRYFPVTDAGGKLLPKFITVANLDSKQPELVVDGNERVIRPRLADAEFFWNTDRQTTLADRRASLARVVYQQGLGTMADKAQRVGKLAVAIANELGIDDEPVSRAAELAKCDLVTGMVGEFPELQGVMGRHYALGDGESDAVADAIREHYQPAFAGDALPPSQAGQVLALADRIDTLAGIFVLGKKPSGNRDPFGLRRAALGIVRLLVECDLPVRLEELVALSVESQGKDSDVAPDVMTFITERLKGYVGDRGTPVEQFDAVAAVNPEKLTDFMHRLDAVAAFNALPEAESLASANKRIANILKKSGAEASDAVDSTLLQEDAERQLLAELRDAEDESRPLLEEGRYKESLVALAALKGPVDAFFDNVMVMADDDAVRRNRLALLSELRRLFSGVADLSRLSLS